MVHLRRNTVSRPWLAVLALCACPAAIRAAEPGEPAPPVRVARWIRGGSETLDAPADAIRVLWFWSSRCPLSRAAVPRIGQWSERYEQRGVRFLAISPEQDDADHVAAVVEKFGSRIRFPVAVDDQRRTTDAYLGRTDEHPLPVAVIVDARGIVVWIGDPCDPSSRFEETLDGLLDGSLTGDWYLARRRAQAALRDYLALLRYRSPVDADEARRVGERVIELGSADAELMNDLAWAILDDRSLALRDLELAARAAKAAYAASGGRSAHIVDTYARSLYELGHVEQALEQQRIAVSMVPENSRSYRQMRQWLARYEREAARKQP